MNLADEFKREPYQGYAYGYPHKTAYGALSPHVSLAQAWAEEAQDPLTLYVHIPFCEMRCGFCNLFTLRGENLELESAYLETLERQTERVLRALPSAKFRAAILGGGTPTQLSLRGLERVLRLLTRAGAAPKSIPSSVETSPRTADAERLDMLRAFGIERISIGVQSFDERESRALGRPQQRSWVEGALERIRARGFPILNLDLIYGVAGQTRASLRASLDAALSFAPEELYLYPLYVRPLTGLGLRKTTCAIADARVELYRAARDYLLERGYEQVSMRFFRRPGTHQTTDTCCQEDATVGIGCGARSYTRALHHAFEWAVAQPAIRNIVQAYIESPSERFDFAHHGVWLCDAEQRRRYVIKTLLRKDGVPLKRYQDYFGTSALSDILELEALCEAELAQLQGDALRLTEQGLELSDAIGPYLYSAEMRARMANSTLS